MRLLLLVVPFIGLHAPQRLVAQECDPGSACAIDALIAQRCSAELGSPCSCTNTTREQRLCARLHYDYADSVLNAVYRETLAAIDDKSWLPADTLAVWKQELRNAQRAWIQFKERDCALVRAREYAGGSLAPVMELECLRAHTQARTRQLRDRYTDPKP